MKYKHTQNNKTIRNPVDNTDITVYQVQYLTDIIRHGIKAGDLGGWLEKEENLSQTGDSVVTGESIITGDASVYGSALVHDSRVHGMLDELDYRVQELEICGSAKVLTSFIVGSTHIFDNALVINSIIKDRPKLYGNSVVVYTEVDDTSHIFDDSIITNLKVTGNKRVTDFYGFSSNKQNTKQEEFNLLFADV